MRRICAEPLAVVASGMLLTGCLSSDLRIMVRPNGSGTLTHAITISKSAWAQFDAMAAAAGDPTALTEQRRLVMTERDAELITYRLGKNARMVSTRAIASADTEGRTSVYAFERIEDLKIDFLPPGPGMLIYGIGVQGVGMLPGGRLDTQFEFELTTPEPGKKLLTVRFPDQRLDPSAAPMSTEPRPKNTPEELAMLAGFVKGARIELTIEPETRLLRTSSPHREDNRVAVMSLDIEKMALSDEIDRLWGFRPASFDEIRWAVHDLPGATLAIDREVTLEFEAPAETQQPAAAAQPSDTEIFLAPLRTRDGHVVVGRPMNISRSPGYDNQPSFTPDGRSILFASARTSASGAVPREARGGATANQTDIYRYDIGTRRIARVTATPESEYSPTVMPDGVHISVVRVEADQTQRLWRFTADGRDPAVVLPDVRPVGYHAWVDDRTVALFVLGQPATLQVADTIDGKAEAVASGIGRSLQRAPDGSVSFVRAEPAPKGAPPVLTAMKLQRRASGTGFETTTLVRALPGTDELYMTWMPDGTLLTVHAKMLFGWRSGDAAWKPLMNLERFGLGTVTRLAVSPNGDWIALVGQLE
jgi:hypothetical protein